MPKRLFAARPRRPRLPLSRRAKAGRALLALLSVPPLVLAAFGGSTALRIYAGNLAERDLPPAPAPQVSQRLLVFAPHCDDETLGAGGLMRESRLKGCDVRVVIITNGDGFRVGVSREFHKLSVSTADFERYAYLRQGEARTALGVLGIPSDHVLFLGYPDRGLMPMWTDHWSSANPVHSAFTLADHCPYNDSPTPHAPYSGQALLDDIKQQMQAEQPTDIYVTHPSDDHPDHAAASVFVRTALEQLQAQGVPWVQKAHLHYYLVHRGDWPVPQGLHEEASLPPPSPMADLDTQWQSFALSHRDTQRKYAAIERYRSQVEMTSRFLLSFARRNELFGTLNGGINAPGLPQVRDGQIRLDGEAGDWRVLAPVALDPVGDSVPRAFQKSGDITRVFACRDSGFLYVRADMAGALSPRVRYVLTLRPIAPFGPQPVPVSFSVLPGTPGQPHPLSEVRGGAYAWHGSTIEAALPLPSVGLTHSGALQTLYVCAETRFADVTIDQTGFRAIACDPAQPRPTLAVARNAP